MHAYPSPAPSGSILRLVPLLGAGLMSGCVWKTDTYEDPPYDEASEDTDGYLDTGTETECIFTDVVAIPMNDAAISYCVAYSGPDAGAPYDVTAAGTCNTPGSDPGSALDLGEDRWLTYTTQQAYDSVPNLCNYGTGWIYYHLTPSTGNCEHYTELGHNFVMWNGGYPEPLYEVGLGHADCAASWDTVAMLARPSSVVKVSAPGCTAGSATFDLVARQARKENETGVAVQMVPIAETNATFPERAWLRSIEIEDWGDAPMLRFAAYGQELNFSNGNVTGGYVIEAPDTELNLSVGNAMMSAMIGGASIPEGGELPRITLTWSCEVSSPAHYTSVPNHVPHVMNLSSHGVDHRFVLWVDQSAQMIRVAPRGRFNDYIQMPYDGTGFFRGHIDALSTYWEGTISFDGDDVILEDVIVHVEDMEPIMIEQVTLPPM